MTNGNDPAFIRTHKGEQCKEDCTYGLTKREYFAAMAMSTTVNAEDAVKKADDIIAELNKSKGEA